MKKLLTILLLVSLIASTSAQEGVVRVQETSADKVFKLYFKADYEWDVKVQIQAKRGQHVLLDKVYSDGFVRPYNLSNLPEGRYVFNVSFGSTKYVEEVVIGDPEPERVKVAKGPKKVKEKNVVAKERVRISESEKDVKIALLDEGIESLSVFIYLLDKDDFEYFYWEPAGKKEQLYDLQRFDAHSFKVEVVENGKVLAEKAFARN